MHDMLRLPKAEMLPEDYNEAWIWFQGYKVRQNLRLCSPVLQKAFEIFSQQLILRGIEIEWQTEDSTLELMADYLQLEQVFILRFQEELFVRAMCLLTVMSEFTFVTLQKLMYIKTHL